MRDATIARNYAEALLALARKAGDTTAWGTMIADVADAIDRDPNLRHFLESPRVAVDKKNDILGRAFQDRMPRVFVRFLQILVKNRRQMLIPEIAVATSLSIFPQPRRSSARVARTSSVSA